MNGTFECPICLQCSPHNHDIVNGWIGVDLDGTLAMQAHQTPYEIGAPVPEMVARVRGWLAHGYNVRILTSRLTPSAASPRDVDTVKAAIEGWCLLHLGQAIPVTNIKDHVLLAILDDRAVHVTRDTGVPNAKVSEGENGK